MKKFFRVLLIIIGSLFGLFVIIGVIGVIVDKKTPGNPEDNLTQYQLDSLKFVNDSIKAIEEKQSIKEQLERELESINNGIDFSSYKSSIESLTLELALFGAWSRMINEAIETNETELISLSNSLKSKIAKIQAKEFPLIRKSYIELLDEKLWEHDIDVSYSGNGYNIINFTGGAFAANKNIKDVQVELHESLNLYRFKQSRYRWFKGADEYTYYDLNSQKDSDFVSL